MTLRPAAEVAAEIAEQCYSPDYGLMERREFEAEVLLPLITARDEAVASAVREACMAEVVARCGACDGEGGYQSPDGYGAACEYCGRPNDAIRALPLAKLLGGAE